MTNIIQELLEVRKALQFFLATMDVDTQTENMLEVASVFPKYQTGKAYKVKDVFAYGENGVGDAQLYQVLQDHVSAEEWTPDTTSSLYKAIGVSEGGYIALFGNIYAENMINTAMLIARGVSFYLFVFISLVVVNFSNGMTMNFLRELHG